MPMRKKSQVAQNKDKQEHPKQQQQPQTYQNNILDQNTYSKHMAERTREKKLRTPQQNYYPIAPKDTKALQ